MTRPVRIVPALVLGLLFMLLALPAFAGGRDVPDKNPQGSSNTEQQALPVHGSPADCSRQPVEMIIWGGLDLEMSWDEDGQVVLRPAFVGRLTRALGRLLGSGGDGSCAAD
jgi:hypothetical protein